MYSSGKKRKRLFEVACWTERTTPLLAKACTITNCYVENKWVLKDTFGVNNEEKVIKFYFKSNPSNRGYHMPVGLDFFLEHDSKEKIDVHAKVFKIMKNGTKKFYHNQEVSLSNQQSSHLFHTAVGDVADECSGGTINIELEVIRMYLLVEVGSKSNPLLPKSGSLVGNITELFKGEDDLPHGDLVLTCGQQSFMCHKFILAVRSTVFAAMLSNPMKESKDNIVEISDFEPHVLEKFVRFLYTDTVEDLVVYEDALQLLAMSEKYNVDSLKTACEKIICDLINQSNVANAAHLAYQLNAPNLLSYALDTITSNLKDVIETQEFKCVAQNCPDVLVEILKKISTIQ